MDGWMYGWDICVRRHGHHAGAQDGGSHAQEAATTIIARDNGMAIAAEVVSVAFAAVMMALALLVIVIVS
eukprot:350208-Chlamydomonas_euryale.AAC.4